MQTKFVNELVRAVSRSRRVLSYAGPLAIAANMLMWVVGLWLGFALGVWGGIATTSGVAAFLGCFAFSGENSEVVAAMNAVVRLA